MSDINWKDGAVCYANGEQWVLNEDAIYNNKPIANEGGSDFVGFESIMRRDDFQLNEIKVGDYLPKSELDTEQKYNDVVEVFGLFGFETNKDTLSYSELSAAATHYFTSKDYGIDSVSKIEAFKRYCKGRQLTYSQIIAIGKLKRMMLDKVEVNPVEHKTLRNKVTANKYEREITDRQGNSATVDVYDVLKAFEVTCPATQHAVKKLLCSGLRGHKDLQTDLIEAKESIVRAIELN